MRKLYTLLIFLLFCLSCKKDKIDESLNSLLAEPIEIKINPHGITPLAAQATIRTTSHTTIQLFIKGADPVQHHFEDKATEHQIPVLGLYPDTVNEVVFQIIDEQFNVQYDTQWIQTDPLPDYLPDINITVADHARMEPGWTFCDFSAGKMDRYETYPFITDHQGVIRWYADFSYVGKLVMPVSRFENGHLLCAYQGVVYEFDMLGKEINAWGLSGYNQHHDVLEKTNGNLLVAVDKPNSGTVEDHVLELDRNTGDVVNTWDFRQVLDMTRTVINGSSVDWLHMNAVWPDESDGGLVISGKHQGVARVNSNNQLTWILAAHKGWGLAGQDGNGINTVDYLLTAVDANGSPYSAEVQQGDERTDDFDWPWGQHAVMILENGNILLFDNGSPRQFNNSPDNYSRMVEYKIDLDNRTVQQVWAFGRSQGEALQSKIISDVDELPISGNRMMTAGINWHNGIANSRIMEITYPEQEVVFDARVVFKNLENSSEFIWQRFDMLYRAERYEIYK